MAVDAPLQDQAVDTPPPVNPEDSLDFLKRMKSKMSPDDVAKMKAIDVGEVTASVARGKADRQRVIPIGGGSGSGGGSGGIDDNQVQNDFVESRRKIELANAQRELDSLLSVKPGKPATPAEGQPPAITPLPNAPAKQILIPHPDEALPLGARILKGVTSVGKDIGGGLLGIPKHVVGGLLDATNNLMTFAGDTVRAAENAGLPSFYVQFLNEKGNWDPKVMNQAEGQKLSDQQKAQGATFVPAPDKPDTVTGDIIRTGVAFLAARRMIAKGPTSFAGNVAADAGAGAIALKPGEARISNILDEYSPNFITNWLKAKPEDEGTMLGHLKTGLEMGGFGAAVHGVIQTLKIAKAAIKGAATPELGAQGATASADAGAVPSAAGEAPQPMSRAAAETAVQNIKNDLPFESTARPAPTDAEIIAQARANGWPPHDSGNALAVATGRPTVEISPQFRQGFDHFMAQERGDIPTPLSAVEGTANADLRSADFSSTGSNPVKVNLNMINGPDDVKDAIARISTQIPAQAVVKNQEVIEAALAQGKTVDQLLSSDAGSEMAKQVVSLRLVENSMSSQFLDLAKTYAANPGEGAKAEALAAYAKLSTVFEYHNQLGSNLGRGVQAFGIKLPQLSIPYATAVKRIAEETGPESDMFLQRLAKLDTPDQVAAAARSAYAMTHKDWMMYGWYNALLSYKTVTKKAISDAGMAAWNVATRYAAEKIGAVNGTKNGVAPGEWAELIHGYTGSFTDSLKMAQAGLKEGRSQFNKVSSDASFLDAFDKPSALAEYGPVEIPRDNPSWSAKEYLRAAMPTSVIGAFDDFATTANYMAAKRALAYRTASNKGLTGTDLESAVVALQNEPPTWLHRQAVDEALRNTFKEPLTGAFEKFKTLVDGLTMPIGHGLNFELPVGRILMPFVKVPANILRWSYTNSALPLLSASSRISAELAAGGATRDLAMARIGLGTGLSMSMLGLALSGKITGKGPSEKELHRAWLSAGNEEHSIKFGDKQYSYNPIEPFGLMAAAISDTVDIMRFAKEEDSGQAALSLVFGTGEALMSKTYLEGMASFFKTMDNPEKESARYVRNMAASALVPNVVKGFRDGMDPWLRSHYDLLQTIENRLPYLSQGLPPQRTRWGDAIPAKEGYAPMFSGTAAAKMLSPVAIGPMLQTEPIDKWIWDNRQAFPRGPDNKLGLGGIGLHQDFSSGRVSTQIELTPAQHDRLQVLAGNELKDPRTGLGAKDTLNALVAGVYPESTSQYQWDSGSPAAKALVVQKVVNTFREAAKKTLLSEDQELMGAVRAGWDNRAGALTAKP